MSDRYFLAGGKGRKKIEWDKFEDFLFVGAS
jgi:hypothetical protein